MEVEQTTNHFRRAEAALSNSPIRALRSLRLEELGQVLVLSGNVQSFYQKQMAQELVRNAISTCELINSINVA
jgi:hypothetical protein